MSYKTDKEDQKWCADNFVSYESLKSADEVWNQLSKIMDRLNLRRVSANISDKDYYLNIRKAMAAGFFMQVSSYVYHHIYGKRGKIH